MAGHFAAGDRTCAAGSRLSPCVPVAISSDAASRIANVSPTVTSPTGVFIIDRSRCRSSRNAVPKVQTEKRGDHIKIGIAMLTLIESTVITTARHSDSAPIASEAAMALVNREEATDARRPSKPALPTDRIIVLILQDADESPATS